MRVPAAAILWAVRLQDPCPSPGRGWSKVPKYQAASLALRRVADLLSWVREGAPGDMPWDFWECTRMFRVEASGHGVTDWGLLREAWLDEWLTLVHGPDRAAWPGGPAWVRPAVGWESARPVGGKACWDSRLAESMRRGRGLA